MSSNATVRKQQDAAGLAAPKRRMRPRAARPTDADHSSPALMLQSQLAGALAAEGVDEPRWSARRTLAFVVIVNGAIWAGLGVLLHAL